MPPVRVLVWDENSDHVPTDVYPQGIRGALSWCLSEAGLDAKPVHLDMPQQGLEPAALIGTDVLVWWGHQRHEQVSDQTVERIVDRVHNHGLGFVALHSAHYSKPFREILGGGGHLRGGWREDGGREEIRVCAPDHPIALGVKDFVLSEEEYYGAPFDVPPPETTVFQSFFPGLGRWFPSGLCWTVGKGQDPDGPVLAKGQGEGIGRVFYFRPGHETLPTFFDPNVKKILQNAVTWAARSNPSH